MRRQSPKSGTSIAWAIAFLFLLFVIIAASFVWKLVIFLQQSSFDGSHQFNIAVAGEQSEVVSFDPDQQSVTVLDFPEKANSVGKQFFIPIDATVQEEDHMGIKSLLFSAMMHHNGTLSPIDGLKLWWFANTLPKDSVTTSTVPADMQQALLKIPRLMQDKTLYTEGKSITIVNATDESGLGNRLAKLLSNIGGNVIMVTNADSLSDHSSLAYSGTLTYTITRLSHILHLQPVLSTTTPALSDITITIGKDMANTETF